MVLWRLRGGENGRFSRVSLCMESTKMAFITLFRKPPEHANLRQRLKATNISTPLRAEILWNKRASFSAFGRQKPCVPPPQISYLEQHNAAFHALPFKGKRLHDLPR